MTGSNATPASIYDAIDTWKSTLLLDEADSWIQSDPQMRGILDSSHTRATAWVMRKGARYSTFAPIAVAMIGDPPETIRDRCIAIQMERRSGGERRERVRFDRLLGETAPLREAAAQWAAAHIDVLRQSDPMVPSALNDRAADSWRPLLAIADLAGVEEGQLARDAAVALLAGEEEQEPSLTALCHLREAFKHHKVEKLGSEWATEFFVSEYPDVWGERITPMRLANLLRPLGVRPKVLYPMPHLHSGEKMKRGYELSECLPVFKKYFGEEGDGVRPNDITPLTP